MSGTSAVVSLGSLDQVNIVTISMSVKSQTLMEADAAPVSQTARILSVHSLVPANLGS